MNEEYLKKVNEIYKGRIVKQISGSDEHLMITFTDGSRIMAQTLISVPFGISTSEILSGDDNDR